MENTKTKIITLILVSVFLIFPVANVKASTVVNPLSSLIQPLKSLVLSLQKIVDSLPRQSQLALVINGFDYTLGDTLYSYSTQAQPAKSGSYVDSAYHTTVTRLTNSVSDRGSWGTGAGYSTWVPLSSDGQYLIFMNLDSKTSGGPYVAYNASDNSYNSTISGYLDTYLQWWNSQDPEPRWDESGSHPSWLYYRKDKQLRYLDVSNGSDNLVHDFTSDFPSYGSTYYIYNGEEGSSSLDSRYWVFMMRNGASPYQTVLVFVYDKQTNSVVASKNVTGHDPNNVMMSQSGQYVYVAYDWSGAENEFDGPHIYTRDFSSNVKCCTGIPHAVWMYDAQGREVVFYMMGDMVRFTRADNGAVYDLYDQADLGWDGSNLLHTAPNYTKKGWGFISTYSQTGSGGGNNHWSDNQIFAFEIDETKTYSGTKPRIWRISFTQNEVGTDYYYQQPNAQMSRDGTKIWWGANWRSDSSGHSEIYRVDLPSNWWDDLTNGGTSDTTAPSVPSNLSATAISSSQINLSWTASTDAVGVTGYNIYRDSSLIDTSATNSYSNTGLSASTQYTYTVSAYDASGNTSSQSSSASATTQAAADTTAPTVTAFTIPSTASSLTVSVSTFTASDAVGVTGYMTTESSTAPSSGSASWTALAPASYTFSSAGSKTLYAWAKDAAGNVSTSLNDSVTITLPTYSVGGTISGLSGTVVLQNNEGDNLSLSSNGSFTFDTDLNNGSTYVVTILTQPSGQTCAVSSGSGTISSANITNITISCSDTSVPDTTAPTVPTNLSVSTISSSQINLSWTASTDTVGVTGYRIYRDGTLITTTSSTSYSDTGLSASTEYTYYITAYDAAGNISSQTSPTEATTSSSSSSNNDNSGSGGGGGGGGGSSKKKTTTNSSGNCLSNKIVLSTNLSFGSKGVEVTNLQNFLISQGYLASGNATGYFGPMTESAVKSFQKAQGIVSSGGPTTTGYGNVGPTTRARISSLSGTSSQCQTTATTQTAVTGLDAQIIRERIAELQKLVNLLMLKLQSMQ